MRNPAGLPTPHWVTGFPEFVNSTIRLLPASATNTLPAGSTARAVGLESCPTPEPYSPHEVTKLPEAVNFWIRLLRPSAAYTFPEASTATSQSPLNWLFPAPAVPHWVR